MKSTKHIIPPHICQVLFLLIVFLTPAVLLAQAQPGAQRVHSGSLGLTLAPEPSRTPCIHPQERVVMNNMLDDRIQRWRANGKIPRQWFQPQHSRALVGVLEWPLRQADGFNDPGYYRITNYIDHDPDSNSTQDYNCLNRTYDRGTYDHDGTDIAIFPYPWNSMDDGRVEIIAAADGMIISKAEGNFDRNCAMGGGTSSNNVILLHSDGSRTLYLHMRTGSVTSKDSGDFVVTGEYLGLVGSSGSSTGPHLHFEVNDSSGQTLDPWAGTCNPTTNSSWWANQKPYYDTGLNRIVTHSSVPVFPACPNPTILNEENVFNPGDSVFHSHHYRHYTLADSSEFWIQRPDNSIATNTRYGRGGSNNNVSSSSWTWFFNLPNNAPVGLWRITVRLESVTYGNLWYTQEFWVTDCNVSHTFNPGTNMSGAQYFQASNFINSSATHSATSNIVYDGDNYVELGVGLYVPSGADLEVKLDGCN